LSLLKFRPFGVERGEAFCERPFALHRQQAEKDKQTVDVAPPGKICADAHDCVQTMRQQR